MIDQRSSRAWRAIIMTLVAGGLFAIALAWSSWKGAARETEQVLVAHGIVERQIEELERLGTEAALVEDRPLPGETIVEPIRAQLSRLGIDPIVLTDLTSSAPSTIPGTPYSRQRIALTLTPIGISDCTRFVDAWRRAQPLWTISAVTADRHTSRSRVGAAAMQPDNRFAIHLTLENVHMTPVMSSAEESE